MTKQIGPKLGLFTVVREDNQLMYVHSKLLIIDDKFASIGSANSNPRSYKVDTELDFFWYEAAIAEKLRTDLWNEMLGKPATMKRWKPPQFVAKWTAIAKKKNISGSASAPKGFAMPFENNNKGKKSLFDISPFT
ncbi:MAG: phospholipase D-like domain-containing protein [Nitrosospira sp.]